MSIDTLPRDAVAPLDDGRRFITDIWPGARRREQLGDLPALAVSIAVDGLHSPVVITQGSQLISGYRRLQAAKLLGLPDIPVRVAANLAEAVGWIVAENKDRTGQKPMTAGELVAYVAMLKGLHRTPEMNTLRTAVTAIYESSYSHYCLIQRIVDAARDETDPDGPAHAALRDADAVLTGRRPLDSTGRPLSITTIEAALSGTQKPAPIGSITPIGRREPVREQAKALASAVAGLNGLVGGISRIDAIDQSVGSADAGRWMADISRAQRALRRLHNQLKEHTDATR